MYVYAKIYFLCLSSASNNLSASSLVFTLNSTGVGGGSVSGSGKQTIITVFLFIRLIGMLPFNSVFNNKLPKDVSALTINWILSFGVGFRNSVPTPRSLNAESFLTNTLHLEKNYIIYQFNKLWKQITLLLCAAITVVRKLLLILWRAWNWVSVARRPPPFPRYLYFPIAEVSLIVRKMKTALLLCNGRNALINSPISTHSQKQQKIK